MDIQILQKSRYRKKFSIYVRIAHLREGVICCTVVDFYKYVSEKQGEIA